MRFDALVSLTVEDVLDVVFTDAFVCSQLVRNVSSCGLLQEQNLNRILTRLVVCV